MYADKSLHSVAPEHLPARAPVVWEKQTRKAQNRHLWMFLARVGNAMVTFPREKDRWRRLSVQDAARILLITIIITRPDLNAARIGLNEETAYGGDGLIEDEGFGRAWGDGSFEYWDDGERRNGLWMDLAAVAWKVMQNHPERGKAATASDLAATIGVSVERIRHLPIPDECKPVLMNTARYLLSHPERFDAAAKNIKPAKKR